MTHQFRLGKRERQAFTTDCPVKDVPCDMPCNMPCRPDCLCPFFVYPRALERANVPCPANVDDDAFASRRKGR